MNAIYAGSFNPFTLGHLDIATRAAKLFDTLVIGVAEDSSKNCIPAKERLKIVELSLKNCGIKNIKIEVFKGLTTDFALKNNAKIIVRGIRNSLDAETERNLARIYKDFAPEIEVITLFSHGLEHVSSSAVRQLVAITADVSGYIAKNAIESVNNLYKK